MATVDKYNLVTGFVKKLKETIVYVVGFVVFVFLTDPTALQAFLDKYLGSGAVAIFVLGMVINYIKVTKPDWMPRLGEK